jgi:hypothetical protein
VAPIHRAKHPPFSSGKNDFQTLAGRSAEIPSPEVAFS